MTEFNNVKEVDYSELATHDVYELFLHEMKDEGVDLTDLSFYDWRNFWAPMTDSKLQTYLDKFYDKDGDDYKPKPLGFKPTPGLSGAALGGYAFGQKFFRVGDLAKAANVDAHLKSARANLKMQAEEFVKQKIKDSAAQAMKGLGVKTGVTFEDDGDGGTTMSGYSGGSQFNPTGLSLGLRPLDSQFRTNIVPGFRPKYFLDTRNFNNPLIVKYLNVWVDNRNDEFDPSYSNSVYEKYWSYSITGQWISYVQQNVSLNSYLQAGLTPQNMRNYFRVVSYALAVYYFYASVIAHFNLRENRNDAMIALFQNLSPDDLLRIVELRKTIERLPIPDDLNAFMFHLYGNYKQSHLPGSCLIKFMPVKFANSNDRYVKATLPNVISGIEDMIASDNFRITQNLLAKACPNWCNTDPFAYTGIANYDADFVTAFVNVAKFGNDASGGNEMPTAASDVSPINYCLHTDAPDGWAQGCMNIRNASSNQWEGGLGFWKTLSSIPVNGIYPNQALYTSVTNTTGQVISSTSFIYTSDTNIAGVAVNGFFPLETRTPYVYLSGDTYKASLPVTGVSTRMRFGSQLAIPQTIQELIPTVYQWMDFFYMPPGSNQRNASVLQVTQGRQMSADADEDDKSKPRRRRRRR